MNRVLFLISFFLVFSSCQIGLVGGNSSILSSNVHIIIAPQGSGDKVFSRNPNIFLKGGQKICRRRPFRASEARTTLENAGLEKDFLDEFFDEEDEKVEGNQGAGDERQTNDPVKMDVGDNWLRFGLFISNANKGKDNFFLVIDSLVYNATAIYKGQVFSHSGNIDSGYCSSEEGGGETAPYLYLIPPNQKITYSPLSKNPFHNLQMYISGFEILDRSDQASYSQQQRIQSAQQQLGGQGFGNQQLDQNQQTGQNQPIGQNQPYGLQDQQNPSYGPNEIIVIPDYTVELILRGYFMTKSGIPVASFVKRTQFWTASSLK